MGKVSKKYALIVIGAGGTGTYFLKEFSRFHGSEASPIKRFIIFDGDTVEEKNLERQAFATDDIGRNKASVMAEVLHDAFGTPWEAYGQYLTKISQLNAAIKDTKMIPLIIGCVDNHACRLLLEECFQKKEDIVYLDSANEFSTGESVFAYKAGGKVISPCRSHYFPDILGKRGKDRTEMSCEELNLVAPQHIATNMEAGNILLSEVCSLLAGKPHPGLVAFDTASFYREYTPFEGVVRNAA